MSIAADLAELFELFRKVNALLDAPDCDSRWPEIAVLIDREEVLFARIQPELFALWPVTAGDVRH